MCRLLSQVACKANGQYFLFFERKRKHDLSRTRAVCAATVGTPRRRIGNLGFYRTKPALRRTGRLQPRTRPAVHRQNAVGNRRRGVVCGSEKARWQNHGAGQPTQAVLPAADSFRQPESFAAARKHCRPAAQTQKARFHERDLHPLLCKFLAEHPVFAAQSRTIFHEKSGKNQKGADKWLYPDMVGVQFEYADYEHSSLQAWMRKFDRLPIKIFSFEIKKHLDFGNYKEYFFQAVSNSSWANEGYLVALSVPQDGEFREALQKLSQSFGIGIILLDAANLSQSEILSPAKYKKQMDYAVMYELAEKNRDFSQFLTTITEYDHKNSHRYLSEFDKVKSDAEMADYLAEKGILLGGKAEAA